MAELNTTSLINDANLVAYYRFNTGALTTDSSTGGHTLTNTNTVGETASGKFGYACDTGDNNANKAFNIEGDNLGIDGGACSYSLWIKKRTPTTGATVERLFTQASATSDTLYYINYIPDTGLGFFRARNGVGQVGVGYYAFTLPTDDWTHLVMTYDGTYVKAYLNAELIGTSLDASGNGSSAIGSIFYVFRTQDVDLFASCYMDDLAVFNRELLQAEITTLYSPSTGGSFLLHFV